jgi:predicted CoA-binding protein
MNEPEAIRAALEAARTVAVVGCSPSPWRPSHEIALYLQRQGYRVVPVNPGHREILGEPCYGALSEVPADVRIDIVDVFRRSEYVAPVAEEAIARQVSFFFMQLGVQDEAAALRLERAGIGVAMDRCILIEHRGHAIAAKSRNAGAPGGVSTMSRTGIND